MFDFLTEHEYFSEVNSKHPSYIVYKFIEKDENGFIGYINVPKNYENDVFFTIFMGHDLVDKKEMTPWFQELFKKAEETVIKRDRIRKIF